MESSPSANPLVAFSTFIHGIGTQLTSRIEDAKRGLTAGASFVARPQPVNRFSLPFASVSQNEYKSGTSLSPGEVAKKLVGTSLYTVSNTNNEFVLISNPDGIKSIGLLCFRREDAEAFLAQVKLRKGEVKGGAKVVPITLDQVYMLKVEGIAFRFLPDPVQLKNALEVGIVSVSKLQGRYQLSLVDDIDQVYESLYSQRTPLKTSNNKNGFDGVPVFQSDLLVIKKKQKRYLPLYFQKEDIEKELSKVSRVGRNVSQHIVVGSLEDVLKKMEVSEEKSGWEDLIFIPPGKNQSQHIQEIAKG